MEEEIDERIEKMRSFMRNNKIQAFIVPSTDPHSGEYIAEYWECRKCISGFTGSAGTVVITKDKARLWTDSRYFIQAEEQLKGTCISLFKEKLPDTPTITEWLGSELKAGDKVGLDPWTNSISEIESLKESLRKYYIDIQYTPDPFDAIWDERPALPNNKIFSHDIKYAGVSAKEKINGIRDYLKKTNKDVIIFSALDEICWLLNLRGNDIHCNPVFIGYLIISKSSTTLYTDLSKIDNNISIYFIRYDIQVHPYDKFANDLTMLSSGKLNIAIPSTINGGAYDIVKDHAEIVTSPVTMMKAIKNETQIEGFHEAMIRDGVAMVKFLIWIKQAVRSGNESELSVTDKLHQLRSEQELFMDESFDTIAGYKENAAIVHYEADETTNKALKPEGMLLLDSGGQYLDGTTDITRTIILGKVSDEEKQDYTLVLKGMMNLANAEFPYGTCGTQLDVLARTYMWKYGINYMHGTGHGVGHFLNVHEGPHQIGMNHMPTLLVPGMTVTDEPGIYKEGRHGVRIENTLLVVKSRTTEFGDFYKFEALTLCPIDKEGIDISMLDDNDIDRINNYHAYVFSKLSPRLSEEEIAWLKEATSPISKSSK